MTFDQRLRLRRKFDRQNFPLCRMNIALCTAFALLQIIVMSVNAMGFHPYHGRTVDKPSVSHCVPMVNGVRENAIKISVARDGKVFFSTSPVAR